MYLSLFSILIYAFSGSWIPAVKVEGARILAAEPVGGRSHWNFMSGILRALVDNGHNVTVFTPFPNGNRENYTEVNTSVGTMTILDMGLKELMDNYGSAFKIIDRMGVMSRELCNQFYEHRKMKEIFASTSTDFDVFLIEPLFSECVSYVAVKLNLPLIYVLPVPTMGIMERQWTGHMSNPAVVSNNMADYGIPKTFVQKTSNIAIFIYGTIVNIYNRLLKHTEPKEYDSHAPIPPSLIFVNRHFTIEPASPTLPNVVEVGGIHLKAAEKLPKVRAVPIVKRVFY